MPTGPAERQAGKALPPVIAEGRGWFVIDKPAGLAVHPGPKTPHSLEALLPAYAPGRPLPAPAHRLDRDTSGCLVLARRASVLRRLAAAFAAGQVEKRYWAIIENPPMAESGHVDCPLAKTSTRAGGWRMVEDESGKPARTGWTVLARQDGLALVEFRPETGRTHQIRVHATKLAPGAAILGDPVYGRAHPAGMMLHAREIRFPDPDQPADAGPPDMKTAEAPCPGRFLALGFDWTG